MSDELTTTEHGMFEAYKAGFELSCEGFNGDYGGPTDEWLLAYFMRDVLGVPLPLPCGRPSDDPEVARKAMTTAPRCTRPTDHEGKHGIPFRGVEW